MSCLQEMREKCVYKKTSTANVTGSKPLSALANLLYTRMCLSIKSCSSSRIKSTWSNADIFQ